MTDSKLKLNLIKEAMKQSRYLRSQPFSNPKFPNWTSVSPNCQFGPPRMSELVGCTTWVSSLHTSNRNQGGWLLDESWCPYSRWPACFSSCTRPWGCADEVPCSSLHYATGSQVKMWTSDRCFIHSQDKSEQQYYSPAAILSSNFSCTYKILRNIVHLFWDARTKRVKNRFKLGFCHKN